jgi:hypothetical protein
VADIQEIIFRSGRVVGAVLPEEGYVPHKLTPAQERRLYLEGQVTLALSRGDEDHLAYIMEEVEEFGDALFLESLTNRIRRAGSLWGLPEASGV